MIEEKSIVAVTNILPNPHFTERWILYKMNKRWHLMGLKRLLQMHLAHIS